jgi:hypothetical protein
VAGVPDPDAFRAQVADWLTQDANPSTCRSYPLALGLPLTWVAHPLTARAASSSAASSASAAW